MPSAVRGCLAAGIQLCYWRWDSVGDMRRRRGEREEDEGEREEE